MAYTVVLLPSARRELASLPREAQRRIARHIDALASDPRPAGAQMLRGPERILRLRVGDYRMLFQVEDKALAVVIVKIGHRREVYRRR